MDGSRPIILNAMPKISIMVKLRRSSCLYPSLAVPIVSYMSCAFGQKFRTQISYIMLTRQIVIGADETEALRLSSGGTSVAIIFVQSCTGLAVEKNQMHKGNGDARAIYAR